MSRSRTLPIVTLTGCLVLNSAATLFAQSDAETALNNARQAYAAELFEQARNAAQKASQTDEKNPDVFLLLGKAHFQLGEVDEALVAWQTVLKLAPSHEYARRMVNALEGRSGDADTQIRLASTMVHEGLLPAAQTELQTLRQRMSLSKTQQQSVLILLAEIAVHNEDGETALAMIKEVISLNADAKGTLPMRYLTARARLIIGGESTKPALDELTKIAEDSADTPEGKAAVVELLLHQLASGEDTVEEIAAWVAENRSSPAARRVHVALHNSVHEFINASASMSPPESEDDLNEHDRSALAAAEHTLKSFVDVRDQIAVVALLTEHLEKRYAGNHAYAAARNGLTQIEEMNLLKPALDIVAATHSNINEAEATFTYTSISRDIGEAIAAPEDLQKWITDHAGHPKEVEALRTLLFAYLNVTRRQAIPQADATLSDADLKAIAVAERLIPKLKSSADAAKITDTLKQHFQKHYFDRGAHNAAIAGMKGLLTLESPARRGGLLVAIGKMQTTVAINELKTAVAAGTIPPGLAEMPSSLEMAAKTIAQACEEYPAQQSWTAYAHLGQQVLDAAGSIPWPTVITEPKAAHGWALNLALPVVKQNASTESVECAQAVIERVVNELAALKQIDAARLATDTHKKLLALIPLSHDLRVQVVLRHVDLLTADAARTFDANVRTGESNKNKAPTEMLQTILKLLSEIVKQRPAQATVALQKLDAHLQKWSAAQHFTVVESAYQSFVSDLPPTAKRQTQLAVAAMWFNQVLRNHAQIAANGFQIPRALDERSQKALQQCYELNSSSGSDDPLRSNVSLLRKRIVDHYLSLEYDDIAEVAIKVKADVANADLDEAAELELAGLKRRIAQRQLGKQLQRHNGKKQLALTPAFNEAIAALKKFITDHPTSERVPAAADSVFSIGQLFEQHEAWLIAAGIYEDFEKFAGNVDSLKQAKPKESTYPEKAAIAYASALHTAASKALQKWNSEKADDVPSPVELSKEFQAAQAAWHKIVASYQQRPVAQTAIARSMAIATEYATLNAWDVSDSVYETILGLQLPLHSPERLEFGRAICQLGKVLPDHARTVLAALDVMNAGRDDSNADEGEQLIALGAFGLSSRISQLEERTLNMPASEAVDELAATAAPQPGRNTGVAAAAESAEADLAPTEAIAGNESISSTDMSKLDGQLSRIGGIGGGGFGADRSFMREADAQLIAAVKTQLDRQASQVAMLRDDAINFRTATRGQSRGQQAGEKVPVPGQKSVANTVLSEAELQRQQTVLDAVYAALQDIRNKYADTSTAGQARDEIFVIVNHWREIAQWDRAAQLARKFLADNPTDINLPKIRQEVARDWLAWASLGIRDPQLDREELLTEISRRFNTAREELQAIIVAFPDETAVLHQAQWDIATSFLTQARVVAASSPTLARGQFVRAATELLQVAELFHDHPKIGTIPDLLWGIGTELATRTYHDEAITVWNELQIHYPTHKLADQSALQIAKTWQQVGQPLRAAEAFLELNFARGGADAELQNTIYQIAVALKNEKRWIESLHVLQTFVDSFPAHANAGQSLTMIGQIHQANEVWEDAIAAYRRVIDEFPTGAWTTEARWSIAECTINLSLWQEAAGAYAEFREAYPKDGRVAEAARRIEVLKTLDRYQDVIDEEGQRKAFDAQFQVAVIVKTELSNPVKAIIEYRKVEKNWPQSHLADDALFEIGKIYLELGETEPARTALLQSAERYPRSPLADDALLLVGSSFVSEADQLAAVDRGKSQAMAKDIAQRQAYQVAQDNRKRHITRNNEQIAALKVQGKRDEAAKKEAYFAGQALQFDAANTLNVSNWAVQQEEVLSAAQMADRQDKINAALRQAVGSFRKAASVQAADTADDALLQMAQIYYERLKDSVAAMSTWEEIVRQYSGTDVAEDASWKMARYFENQKEHEKAIAAYQTFFRNYRRSPRAGEAQAAIAENHEKLGEWVEAMDAYTNYVNNFPEGPLLKKAQNQINWIKTYRL